MNLRDLGRVRWTSAEVYCTNFYFTNFYFTNFYSTHFLERTMLPGWIYVGVVIHVLIAIVFISSLLYYHNKANTLAVKVVGSVQLFLIHDDDILLLKHYFYQTV